MKRSDMVKNMVRAFGDIRLKEDPTEEEGCSMVLVVLETLGMLPPPLPKSPLAKIKNRCKWEAEENV